MTVLLSIEVRREHDIVQARLRARQISGLLGFVPLDQTRIATAVSEIVRNALQYAGGGRVEYAIETGTPSVLSATIRDQGPGIDDVEAILDGRFASTTGVGMGLVGARRVMDRFQIDSTPGRGTAVILGKFLPARSTAESGPNIARVAEELARLGPEDPFDEVLRQNQELLRALEEIRKRETDATRLNRELEATNGALRRHEGVLAQLNRELEETNRGVMALYAELDERAIALQRASELKSRFLSDMSHEFRTPLNSIRSLAKFLLDPADGPLSAEKDRQARYILKAAENLSEMVNDLLDLAKVEAGRVDVHAEPFEAADLFAALRGMFRPLVDPASPVALAFDEPTAIETLQTDEGKVAQVLRNFISNALKFTEKGEVRVSARADPGDRVEFEVADTGIGIAPEDLGRIFEEFAQVSGPAQRRVQGTGLGLPLSRKLAELLGGTVSVSSRPGGGSTFTATIPRRYPGPRLMPEPIAPARPVEPGPAPVLVLEDDPATLYIYEKFLIGTGFVVLHAASVEAARELLRMVRPVAVILDILLELESGWTLLSELKGQAATRDIPVLVLTVVDGRERALALGADAFCLKPVERPWLVRTLGELSRVGGLETILIIDDDESCRYVLKSTLALETQAQVIEASDGAEGLRRAREAPPQAIFLDLFMPDMTGFEVLDRLKADPTTREVPVIIHSSRDLTAEERRRLSAGTAAILSKEGASRDAALNDLREALAEAGLGPGR